MPETVNKPEIIHDPRTNRIYVFGTRGQYLADEDGMKYGIQPGQKPIADDLNKIAGFIGGAGLAAFGLPADKFASAVSEGKEPPWKAIVKDLIPDITTQAMLSFIPGGTTGLKALKYGGAAVAGTAVDQLLHDKSLANSVIDTGINMLLGQVGKLPEMAGISYKPRTKISTRTSTPTEITRSASGRTEPMLGEEGERLGSQWSSEGNATIAPGGTTTTTETPHVSWLGNLIETIQSIKLDKAMKHNVSTSGYKYPKAVPVKVSPLQHFLAGMGLNALYDTADDTLIK